MDGVTRREPAFDDESEAYLLYKRGVRFLADRHPGQAALLLGRALGLEPGRHSIRESLGRAEYALGRYERAAELFAGILAEAPDDDYAQYALSRCCVALRKPDEARAHLRLARALRPASELYRDAHEDDLGGR